MRKTIWLKILPNILFNQFITLRAARYAIYRCRNVLEKISTTSNFRSTFAVTIEVNNEVKYLSGIRFTTISKFHFL